MGNRSTTLHDTTLLTGRPIEFAPLTLICRRPTFSSKVDVQLRTLPNSTLGPLVRYRAVAAQVTAPWLRDRSPVLRFVRGRLMAGLPNGAQRAAPNQTACFPTMSASLIGHLGSSAFRLSTTTVSMSLAGSCFSSESAPSPFHHGIRGRGGTIFRTALPSIGRQVQAEWPVGPIHARRASSFWTIP